MAKALPEKDLVVRDLSPQQKAKILTFEYGFTASEELADEQITQYLGEVADMYPLPDVKTRSQRLQEDPVGQALLRELSDPLSDLNESAIQDRVAIHRRYDSNTLIVIIQSRYFSTRGDMEEKQTLILKNAIRAVFAAYKKACKFFTPDIYNEDSFLFTMLKALSEGNDIPLTLEGQGSFVENLQESTVDLFGVEDWSMVSDEDRARYEEWQAQQTERVYNLQSAGLTEEDITDPKKLIEKAKEFGILEEYNLSDYTDKFGYGQFLLESEYIVLPEQPIYFYFEFDAAYFDAIPTTAEIRASWVGSGIDRRDEIDQMSDRPWRQRLEDPETAGERVLSETAAGRYLGSERGALTLCIMGASWDDPECQREVEQIDAMGMRGLMDPDLPAGERESILRNNYPQMARNYDHLMERYGSVANALADPKTRGKFLKNAGKALLKAEAKALYKQLMDGAARNNMTNDYKAAAEMAKKAATRNTSGVVLYDIGKYDLMVNTVVDAMEKFHDELEDFRNMDGFIRVVSWRPLTKKDHGEGTIVPTYIEQSFPQFVDNWHADEHYGPNNKGIMKPGNATVTINWNQEAMKLKEAADFLKQWVLKNVDFMRKEVDWNIVWPDGNPAFQEGLFEDYLDPKMFVSGTDAQLAIKWMIPYSTKLTPQIQIPPRNRPGDDAAVARMQFYGGICPFASSASLINDFEETYALAGDLEGSNRRISQKGGVMGASIGLTTPGEKSGITILNFGCDPEGNGKFKYAPGYSLGDLLKHPAFSRPTTLGFLRHLEDLYTRVNDFSQCNNPSQGAVGIGGLGTEGGAAATPAGLALGIAADFLYPPADPEGFKAAAKKSAKQAKLAFGESLTPAAKALTKDAQAAYASINDDITQALKRQAAAVRAKLPQGDPRCFSWDYIKSVIYKNWHWRNFLCKVFECLGIPIPWPFPELAWPGWAKMWPPKFPWPPKNPLMALWQLIKAVILQFLCGLITTILDLLKLDCDLLALGTEEFIDLIPGGAEWLKDKKEELRGLSGTIFGDQNLVVGAPSEEDIQARIRGELNISAECEDLTMNDDVDMDLGTGTSPLTSADYDPFEELTDWISDMTGILTPAEFCELLAGAGADQSKELALAVLHERYPRLERSFGYDDFRALNSLAIVGEETIGADLCTMLAYAPDMVTPPAKVCHSQHVRENLLNKRLTKDELELQIAKEKERQAQLVEAVLAGSETGNIFTGNGLVPEEMVGGTAETPSTIVPLFSEYDMDFGKRIIESYFDPIKYAYNTDIELFTDYLTDDVPQKALKQAPTAPGELSEREEALIFKQMMENPYSGLYRNYQDVVEELGEIEARSLKYLHFFRPLDAVDELPENIKQQRAETMFESHYKHMAIGAQPGSKMPEKEIAKRLKELLTNSSLVETEKEEDGNFFVSLKFPNSITRRDFLTGETTEEDLGGTIVYDSTPGIYCSTDFNSVDDSYKINFNGPFFAKGMQNADGEAGLESFEAQQSIPLIQGDPIHTYFKDKFTLWDGETLQPHAFAELLAINQEKIKITAEGGKYEHRNRYHMRDDIFFQNALETYNEMEQYIFEVFGRFISKSDVINPLEEGAVFPRGSGEPVFPSDEGRAGIELMDLNPLYQNGCPVPGLMDWNSVKEKVITQFSALLTEGLGDEPSWPSPMQYSVATAGFLNSWVRLEIVQIILEGLASFYEFGLSILEEPVMQTFIKNRIELRTRQQGIGFRKLFETLAKEVLGQPETNSGKDAEKTRPKDKKSFSKFDLKRLTASPIGISGVDASLRSEVETPFDYKLFLPMISNNIRVLKDKIGDVINADVSVYDGFYETFPSIDLFKNIKILYDPESGFVDEDLPDYERQSSTQEMILRSRSVRSGADDPGRVGYKPADENQIFEATTPEGSAPKIKEQFVDVIQAGSFVFQKYIRFVPNESGVRTVVGENGKVTQVPGSRKQTKDELMQALNAEGSATSPALADQGVSFLQENPGFFPGAIPLGDFRAFIEGLGGPPPEEEGDMSWWADHFASRQPESVEEEFPGEGSIPYPENTYINDFSSESSRKRLASAMLVMLTSPPKRENTAQNWNSVNPYFSESKDGLNWETRFMDPVKVFGPEGRQELQVGDAPEDPVYGNYVNDVVASRSASGSGHSNEQGRFYNRALLDFWQIPENADEIPDYEKDYENLWIPVRFEVVDYKYKELPRFVHGSNDLYKDRQGVIQTLKEIKDILESVMYKAGPWDAMLRDYTHYDGQNTGNWMREYHAWENYSYNEMKSFLNHNFTLTGFEIGQANNVAESQTWDDCIVRGLKMIKYWPDLGSTLDDERLEGVTDAAATLWVNPWSSPPRREKNWERAERGIWSFQRKEMQFGMWWHDLACLIANETDREGIFTPIEGHPLGDSIETSPMSMFLSMQEHDGHYAYFKNKTRQPTMREWATIKLHGKSAGNRGFQAFPGEASADLFATGVPDSFTEGQSGSRSSVSYLNDNYDYYGFYYFCLYPWGHRPGYGTHSDWWPNQPANRYHIRPDIWPHMTYKSRDRGKGRPCDAVTYRGYVEKKPAEVRKWRDEAVRLLEAREKFNLSVDPSTLDERGRNFWGYYEKFLLQRLRMPYYDTEMYQYGWFHQANYRFINAPKKVRTRSTVAGGADRTVGYTSDLDVAVYGQYNDDDLWGSGYIVYRNKMGCSWKAWTRPDQHDNRGFSYREYGLPDTPEEWTLFMKEIDSMIEYVKSTPATASGEDTAVSVAGKQNVDKQYVVHFVNAKAIFSGTLRWPKGPRFDDAVIDNTRLNISASEFNLINVESEGVYEDTGGFKVVEALMDPNHSAWPQEDQRFTRAMKTRLIRDNVKTVAHSGVKGRKWWRHLMSIWGFKSRPYWKSEYTTEMVGETKYDIIGLDSSATFRGLEVTEGVAVRDETIQFAGLHPVGGDPLNTDIYLWSRAYKTAARDAFMNNGVLDNTPWAFDAQCTVDSQNAFFFTWADPDIQQSKSSPRAVTKYMIKNKLAERVIGVGFDQEAMWFGDQSLPADLQEVGISTPDRPSDYWNHTRLTPLIESGDFGRLASLSPNDPSQFAGYSGFQSVLNTIKGFFNAGAPPTDSLDSMYNNAFRATENSPEASAVFLRSHFTSGQSALRDRLRVDQLSLVDFWPSNTGSDNNPYCWHRDYVLYNAFRKTEEIKRIQSDNYTRNFYRKMFDHNGSLRPGREDPMSWSFDSTVNRFGRDAGNKIHLGIHDASADARAANTSDVIILQNVQPVTDVSTNTVSLFLPHSDIESLYIPSPFGIHPNLGLYTLKAEDDPGNERKKARINSPYGRRQMDPTSGWPHAPLFNESESDVYTATKTMVRKRVRMVIDRPEHVSEDQGSLANWLYGAESSIAGLEDVAISDDVRNAILYFDNAGLEGKKIETFPALSSSDVGDDLKERAKAMKKICKDIEAENILAFTYMRMWQARRHYLKAYAKWAEEDVIKAFERLTTSLADCNMNYGSRMIYLPKLDDEGIERFGDWIESIHMQDKMRTMPASQVGDLRDFFDEDLMHMGLEVVGPDNDRTALLANKITSRSQVVPIPYVPITEAEAPLSMGDLVQVEKASAEEIEALGFTSEFADIISQGDGLKLVKFITQGDDFVDGAFKSSLLPTNAEDPTKPAINVQDYIIGKIKESPESQILFKYLFPLKRYASIYAIYNISATSSLYNMNALFADTRERLKLLLKLSMDLPYDKSLWDIPGLMTPAEFQSMSTTKYSMFRLDQFVQVWKQIKKSPKTLAHMLLTITDPFYFDGINKLQACNLRYGLRNRSFAQPGRNKSGHKPDRLKPFTMYPPIPYIPPIIPGPMGAPWGYDSNLDSMASPIGPMLLAVGGLPGDDPKKICNYDKTSGNPGIVDFGYGRFTVGSCPDDEE